MLEPILIVPDTHSPFEDVRAWNLMLKVAKHIRPTRIVHLGDMADFYALSAHDKNPRRAADLSHEVKHTRGRLRELANIAPLDYVEGNHEHRLKRYTLQKAPALHELLSTKKLLGLGKMGIKLHPYGSSLRIGKMRYTHDVQGRAGKHAVVGSLEAMGHSVSIGHIHRIGYHINGTVEGERHAGVSYGWLGDASAIDYLHRDLVQKDWALGFGLNFLDTDTGFVTALPIPILPDYSCVVLGKQYKQPVI